MVVLRRPVRRRSRRSCHVFRLDCSMSNGSVLDHLTALAIDCAEFEGPRGAPPAVDICMGVAFVVLGLLGALMSPDDERRPFVVAFGAAWALCGLSMVVLGIVRAAGC